MEGRDQVAGQARDASARWGLVLLVVASVAMGPGLGMAHQLTGTEIVTLTMLSVDYDSVNGSYEVQYGDLAGLAELRQMDRDRDGQITSSERQAYLDSAGATLGGRLTLTVGGEPVAISLEEGEVLPAVETATPEKLTVHFAVSCGAVDLTQEQRLEYRDANDLPRLVHSDVTIEGLVLVDVVETGLDARGGALKEVYIQSLSSPVEAAVTLKPAEAAWGSMTESMLRQDGEETEPASQTDALQEMLRAENLSTGLVIVALGLALFLGAVHALEPGHGKTLVAAYLIGSRGTVANALFLGVVVTLTHTFSVILLGLITLFASQYILPEQIFPWLGAGSGLLIMGMGLWLYTRVLTGRSGHVHFGGHSHDHGVGHDHGEAHGHGHEGPHDHGDEHSHGEDHGHEHPHEHGDEHSHGEDHGHEHPHKHGDEHSHGHDHGEGGDGEEHEHGHDQEHSHDHGYEDSHGEDHGHEHSHGDGDAHSHGHDHGEGGDGEEHEHGHGHDHEHSHDHAETRRELAHSHSPAGGEIASENGQDGERSAVSLGVLLTLGITGGIIPCPGALIILLVAVGLHRVVFGLVLIACFSVGLAAVLITIGVLMVKARPLMERFTGEGKLIQRLPMFSSLLIIVVGFVMAVRSLVEAGIVTIRF